MAIHCNLSTKMKETGLTIQYVHEKTGIARSALSHLYNDKMKRIDCETLNRLCELFDCETGDIIVYQKE